MYTSISHNRYGAIIIRTEHFPETVYYGYSKRDALKKYREQNGLKHKHLIVFENN